MSPVLGLPSLCLSGKLLVSFNVLSYRLTLCLWERFWQETPTDTYSYNTTKIIEINSHKTHWTFFKSSWCRKDFTFETHKCVFIKKEWQFINILIKAQSRIQLSHMYAPDFPKQCTSKINHLKANLYKLTLLFWELFHRPTNINLSDINI